MRDNNLELLAKCAIVLYVTLLIISIVKYLMI